MNPLAEVTIPDLARLCHGAEDAGDDLLLNEVMGEVDRRNAAAVYTSPTTGLTYPTGVPYSLFHEHYMLQMLDRRSKR